MGHSHVASPDGALAGRPPPDSQTTTNPRGAAQRELDGIEIDELMRAGADARELVDDGFAVDGSVADLAERFGVHAE